MRFRSSGLTNMRERSLPHWGAVTLVDSTAPCEFSPSSASYAVVTSPPSGSATTIVQVSARDPHGIYLRLVVDVHIMRHQSWFKGMGLLEDRVIHAVSCDDDNNDELAQGTCQVMNLATSAVMASIAE